MKPYCPMTKSGYRIAGHDVFRKTADISRGWAKHIARKLRKAARQWAKSLIRQEA